MTLWNRVQQLQKRVTTRTPSESSIWIYAVKKCLNQRNYDNAVSETVVFYNAAGHSDDICTIQQLDPYLKNYFLNQLQ